MTGFHEFELSRLGFSKMTVLQATGRFYEGQVVWGKLVKRDGTRWEVVVVNESGKPIGTIPAASVQKMREDV